MHHRLRARSTRRLLPLIALPRVGSTVVFGDGVEVIGLVVEQEEAGFPLEPVAAAFLGAELGTRLRLRVLLPDGGGGRAHHAG